MALPPSLAGVPVFTRPLKRCVHSRPARRRRKGCVKACHRRKKRTLSWFPHPAGTPGLLVSELKMRGLWPPAFVPPALPSRRPLRRETSMGTWNKNTNKKTRKSSWASLDVRVPLKKNLEVGTRGKVMWAASAQGDLLARVLTGIWLHLKRWNECFFVSAARRDEWLWENLPFPWVQSQAQQGKAKQRRLIYHQPISVPDQHAPPSLLFPHVTRIIKCASRWLYCRRYVMSKQNTMCMSVQHEARTCISFHAFFLFLSRRVKLCATFFRAPTQDATHAHKLGERGQFYGCFHSGRWHQDIFNAESVQTTAVSS